MNRRKVTTKSKQDRDEVDWTGSHVKGALTFLKGKEGRKQQRWQCMIKKAVVAYYLNAGSDHEMKVRAWV